MYGRLRDCLVGDQGILWRCPADWLLVVIVALVISGFAFSPDSQPPVEGFCNWDIGTDFKGADKIKHFISFAALGCFLYRGVNRCTQFAEFSFVGHNSNGKLRYSWAVDLAATI